LIGTEKRSWGEDIGVTNAHGAAVGPDDMLYLTDDFGHAVRKCTTDGKVVLTIGTPKSRSRKLLSRMNHL
jgi:hypothetical protein